MPKPVVNRSLHAHIAARWDPTHSLLGQWVQRKTADRWQAQAYFILVSISLLVVLVIANFVAWGVVGASITAAPEGSMAVAFWWSQLAAFGGWGLISLFGWAPGVQVDVNEAGLVVTQAERTLTMPRWTIERVEVISAMQYHRHYRRYAGTTAFVGALPPHLLLVESEAYCWVLGLAADDMHAVRGALVEEAEQPEMVDFAVLAED
ncbi:MAG: hypothetical protein AAF730_08945 [Bacteroidota bacterium]